MAEWIYDQNGQAGAILDDYSLRNREGDVIAWVFGIGVFAPAGEHIGWFEEGVLFDSDNCALGFVSAAKGLGLAMPTVMPAPALPQLPRRPSTPRLHGKPGRPVQGRWSSRSLTSYFIAPVSEQQVSHSRAMATRLSVRLLRYRQRAAMSMADQQ